MKKRSFLTFLESQIKFLFCTFFLVLVFCTLARAQEKKVTGTVTSAEDNSPMPGVNIIVKGTTTGTATDTNGSFSISVTGNNPVLVFSFIGFNSQEITIGEQSVIDIRMVPALINIDEVVVTSLGIERDKKVLTYSTQTVSTETITKTLDLNLANSLSGKVAGLDLVKSNSGVGSPSRVMIRGNRSIYGNNQPMYVVDGAPIDNSGGGPMAEGGGIAWGDGIGNINPMDIESINVLKGPSAAALYGNRANNGVIIITTKKGMASQGIGVEYTVNYTVEMPVILTRMQNVYGQGSEGSYFKNSEFDWGAKMDGQMVDHWTPDSNSVYFNTKYPFVAHPNNLKDFFQTGTNLVNAIAFTTGGKDMQGYFSYANTKSRGIIPGNDLKRNNFNFRLSGNLFKKLSLDAKITYFTQNVENRVATGDDYTNPMRAVFRQPSNISSDQAKVFEYYDNEEYLRQNYWSPYSNGGENPYWVTNRLPKTDNRERVLTLASAKYDFIDGLSLQVRAAIDFIYDKRIENLYNDTYTVADDGNFKVYQGTTKEINTDFLLNYNKKIGPDFSLNASMGGNMLMQQWYWMQTNNGGLLIPNLFTITNAKLLTASEYEATRRVNSLYGFVIIGFRNNLFLELTGRNDWSSTLPADKWSFFYPSAGLTWVISETFKSRPGWITFAKLRASLAQVGNDTDPYRINPAFEFQTGGANGYASRSWTKPSDDLKSELTTSKELGLDMRFLRNRIGIDFTWYKSNSKNQLLNVAVPIASGYFDKFINAGNIQNSGIETTLNLKPLDGSFKWNMAINFAKNKSLVVELSEGLTEYTLFNDAWMTTHKVVEGHKYDDIYTKGFLRNEAGRILVDTQGLPMTTDGKTLFMGNYNPDWIGGISNSLVYRRFELNFMIDIRMGGDVFSFTQANLAGDGFADYTANGRDGMIVNGVIQTLNENGDVVSEKENNIVTTAEKYWRSIGGRDTPVGEAFKYDASNIRLREASLSYTCSVNNNTLKSISISLVGRNLFFIMNRARILDPNLMVGTSNLQGCEGFGLPGTRTIGMNLKVIF